MNENEEKELREEICKQEGPYDIDIELINEIELEKSFGRGIDDIKPLDLGVVGTNKKATPAQCGTPTANREMRNLNGGWARK